MTPETWSNPLRTAKPTSYRQSLVLALRRAFGVGTVATARALVQRLRRKQTELDRAKTVAPSQPHPFDIAFSVETGGFRSWRELQAGGANDPFISAYLGIAPSIGRRLIGLVQGPEDYTFIDFGCGKGRATILASERPFRRVIGVEIAAELAATARHNASIVRAGFPERPGIEIEHGDAVTYALPPGPLVVFLYHPFERPVMRQVASNLSSSIAASPRPVLVIYVNPVLGQMFDRDPIFERAEGGVLDLTDEEQPFSLDGTGVGDEFAIWRTRDPAPVISKLPFIHKQ